VNKAKKLPNRMGLPEIDPAGPDCRHICKECRIKWRHFPQQVDGHRVCRNEDFYRLCCGCNGDSPLGPPYLW
jgi:hypothetical protein